MDNEEQPLVAAVFAALHDSSVPESSLVTRLLALRAAFANAAEGAAVPPRDAALPCLLAALGHSSGDVRETALLALAAVLRGADLPLLLPPAQDALAAGLCHPDTNVALFTLDLLAALASGHGAAGAAALAASPLLPAALALVETPHCDLALVPAVGRVAAALALASVPLAVHHVCPPLAARRLDDAAAELRVLEVLAAAAAVHSQAFIAVDAAAHLAARLALLLQHAGRDPLAALAAVEVADTIAGKPAGLSALLQSGAVGAVVSWLSDADDGATGIGSTDLATRLLLRPSALSFLARRTSGAAAVVEQAVPFVALLLDLLAAAVAERDASAAAAALDTVAALAEDGPGRALFADAPAGPARVAELAAAVAGLPLPAAAAAASSPGGGAFVGALASDGVHTALFRLLAALLRDPTAPLGSALLMAHTPAAWFAVLAAGARRVDSGDASLAALAALEAWALSPAGRCTLAGTGGFVELVLDAVGAHVAPAARRWKLSIATALVAGLAAGEPLALRAEDADHLRALVDRAAHYTSAAGAGRPEPGVAVESVAL